MDFVGDVSDLISGEVGIVEFCVLDFPIAEAAAAKKG